jgi:hypothetical protein
MARLQKGADATKTLKRVTETLVGLGISGSVTGHPPDLCGRDRENLIISETKSFASQLARSAPGSTLQYPTPHSKYIVSRAIHNIGS